MPPDPPNPNDPPAETEGEEEDESEESDEEEEKELTNKELLAKITELEKKLAEPAETGADEKDSSKEKPNPLVIRFAENLKAQLGKNYPKDFDKIPLESRIPAMEGLVAALNTRPKPKEGKIPKGAPADSLPARVNGKNYKDIAKNLHEGKI